jgi:hypothetical protein
MSWQRWVERGVEGTLLMGLTRLKRINLHVVVLDARIGWAHQHAAGAPQKGRPGYWSSTNLHALCVLQSDMLSIRSMAGPAGDAPVGEELSDALDTRERMAQAAMDKASDSNAVGATLEAEGSEPVIPPQANRLAMMISDHEP